MSRLFHLGDILSITTGRLVSPRLIVGVYDILNYMTGDNLFTHQLPRAGRECLEPLLAQHPQLRNVDASGVTQENWRVWLDAQCAAFGEELAVRPLPPNAHEFIDPISEAAEMVRPDHIVVAVAPDAHARKEGEE